ncbi:XylR N-terminal domain-containing protein [Neobacillus drentensis]|uniref:XylR N-terminal domain-containing protein n=1 Tax=Neobacillus drentensis TaxID=220684 RepID=UPI002FFF57FF
MRINFLEHNYNVDFDPNNRKFITSSGALGLLREVLVKNLGIDRMRGFLNRFGWEMGKNDAQNVMKSSLTLDTLLKQGPIYHTSNGHISGTTYEGFVELDEQNRVISIYGTGTWEDSFEVYEHVNRFGNSKTQVCNTLAGYASGYMSTICDQEVLAKEITCIGKGDKECRWVIKTLKDWDSEIEDELHYYHEDPIVKELKDTYENLMEQKDFNIRLSNFQRKLTEEIANGGNLQTITDMVYDEVGIPIIIEDTDFQILSYSGLSQSDSLKLEEDIIKFIGNHFPINVYEKQPKLQLPFNKKFVTTSNQERLIMPIIGQKKIIGYCCFIYVEGMKCKLENDSLLLDRIANAASLIFLNEKISFDSFERMKGNFLEQLLNQDFHSRHEILLKGRYTGLDLSMPYFLAVLKFEKKHFIIENEFLFHEQVLELTYQYFNKNRKKILICQREGNLILFITKGHEDNTKIKDILTDFHNFLKRNEPKCEYKIGISNEGREIENLAQSYQEAKVALQLITTSKIVLFESLGIVGVLINSNNIQAIKMIAKQELGSLYDLTDPKKLELIKTLYVFLQNGGRLEHTVNDLALSLSGLRHRLKKIETLIERDPRNPIGAHNLLLILETLVSLGELEFS